MNKVLLSQLANQNITNTQKWLLTLLTVENKDIDGFFYLDQGHWSDTLHITKRQLIRYLNDLTKKHLIEKDFRSVAIDSCSARRRLFVKTCLLDNQKRA